MLFNSLAFLIFFPITVIIYFLLPSGFRLFFLFLASCVFYLVGTPWYIAVIFLSILVDYTAGLMLSNAKGKYRAILLCISLSANIGLLFIFKYFNFFSENYSFTAKLFGIHINPIITYLGLPVGLSFHTFQGMSYIIEVYKKRYQPEQNILKYGLYVMFFPQLVAGPIERPQQLLTQFSHLHMFDYEQARNGIRLMLWGMLKKVAAADRIAVFVDPVFKTPGNYNGFSFIVAAALFAYQIYYDFSGYTDIARGAAAVFGYRLEINFNNPYTSNSVQEFWRRWHITLSSWFRDYLYIPLGGNRKGIGKTCRNIFITFLLCGLWHGASWHFIIWGIVNGFYLVVCHIKSATEKLKTITFPLFISIPFTFFCLCIGWIFFRTNTLQEAIYMLKAIFLLPFSHPDVQISIQSVFLQGNKIELFIVLFFIIIVEFVQTHKTKTITKFNKQPVVIRWGIYSLMLWVIILAGKFGQTSFIYYSF